MKPFVGILRIFETDTDSTIVISSQDGVPHRRESFDYNVILNL